MDHQAAQEELRRWKQLFDRAEWGIAIGRADVGLIEMVNPAFARMHDYAIEELVGKPILELVAPDERDRVPELLRTVHERGRHIFEIRHAKRDGTTFPVQLDVTRVRDDTSDAPYIAAYVQDITELQEARRKLEESEKRFRSFYNSTPVMMHSINARAELISVNDHWLRTLGYDRDEVLGRHGYEFLAETSRQYARDVAIPRLFSAGHLEGVELQMVKKTGGVIDVVLSADTIHDSVGGAHSVAFIVDVTDRKLAERALRESQERLARIVESAMDAIVTVDEHRMIKVFNAAAEGVFRCAAQGVMGQSFERFLPPAFRSLLDRCIPAFERTATSKRYLWAPAGLTALRATGEDFPIEATISLAEVGGQRLYTIILRDVNDRVGAERELARLRTENVYLREEVSGETGFEEIVGASPGIKRVLDEVGSVAGTDSTALITGETGTGKELIARAIHSLSLRRDKILVTVNCAALPAGLIESELFGHEKGAFTGALSRKIGRFELADCGTIFLDEIGDLPLELQAKILRALQEGEFERVGSTETRKVNVRIVAATNRDLGQAVAEQRFRADLFYRLNVFPIRLPPLRERRSDIPSLVRHFVLKLSTRMGKRIETIPKAVMEALSTYSWPGNVRELQNVIERGVILSQGSCLELGEWLPNPRSAPPTTRALTMEEMERRHILDALERTGWQVSGERGAAKVLGLRPTTLESRMQRLGIQRNYRGSAEV